MSRETVINGPRGSYSIIKYHMPLWPFALVLAWIGGVVAGFLGAFGNGPETVTWCVFAAVFPIVLFALGMALGALERRSSWFRSLRVN